MGGILDASTQAKMMVAQNKRWFLELREKIRGMNCESHLWNYFIGCGGQLGSFPMVDIVVRDKRHLCPPQFLNDWDQLEYECLLDRYRWAMGFRDRKDRRLDLAAFHFTKLLYGYYQPQTR